MSAHPRRIDQIIPSIIEHDAVSNHTFEAQRLLREMGFESEIYASTIGPGCNGRVRRLEELPEHRDGSQWVLYQCSIGSPAAERFARHPGTKLLDYHNITPDHLVNRWLPPLGDESRLGRRQLATLAPLCSAAFADSAFNVHELDAVGFANATVVPVLVESAIVDSIPDPQKLAQLKRAKQYGGHDWLFVGQIAAHKAQHEIVSAFYCYRQIYDHSARLHLVGREMGRSYRDAVDRFVRALGIAQAVDLPGSVPTAELAAYYESADVFVCCSHHEGFCAPIIEAMTRGVPVVARSAAAVTETVGPGGVLFDDDRAVSVASLVHEVVSSPEVYASLVKAGHNQAAIYTVERARACFRATIESIVKTITT